MAVSVATRQGTVLRHATWDALFVTLSCAHGALLLGAPSVPLVALGLWWNANTISHNFIHHPFFRSRRMNRAYAMYLSALLGFPHEWWRVKHLKHHGGTRTSEPEPEPRNLGTPEPRNHARLFLDTSVVVALFATLAFFAPRFLLTVYLPGYAIGMVLCFLQGHYEHARGTTSHYGRIYNTLFFNDGFHVEHHRQPHAYWTDLQREADPGISRSRWPPVLRWLDRFSLEFLERIVLRSPALQRFVIATHERAFRRLLREMGSAGTITIVGGGLFPRTALILRRLFPAAQLRIVEASAAHLEIARGFLDPAISLTQDTYPPAAGHSGGADILVIPLSFAGDRGEIYRRPPAPVTLVHDWIWSRRGTGATVSWLLLKRLNLVRAAPR